MAYGNYNKKNEQQSLANQAEAWYLCNLLVLPGISFIILARLFIKHGGGDRSLIGTNHVRQTFFMSLLGGGLVFCGCTGLYLWLGNTGNAWMWIIMYFTLVHTSFVMWGILGLAWSLAKKPIAYPRF
ncbi:hypothetical protein [Alkalimarinus alittae]|uniref:Uncharacterized protein n=1 Tax=Alkalimarinus alittae TaxID=2961619 RepID=A0ABY6N6A1_9ALTE|nr:hypothetical protein [Alkalimarinus alittae]UZE97507.1 hypothetical protein NKI27_07120 [Alkalimarinus alittae]